MEGVRVRVCMMCEGTQGESVASYNNLFCTDMPLSMLCNNALNFVNSAASYLESQDNP